MNQTPRNPHAMELLAEAALFGLDEAELAGLECLLSKEPQADREVFERMVASMLSGQASQTTDPLPTGLSEKLLEQGKAIAQRNRAESTKAVIALPFTQAESGKVEPVTSTTPTASPFAYVGWVVAAGLLIFTLLRTPSPVTPSLEEQYAQLVKAGGETWQGSHPDPKSNEVKGEICWSDKDQKGFMKLANLKVNDPKVKQYQLWIFDDKRDDWEKLPVDGGVFDVAKEGEVIIPIANKLTIGKPVLWAITVEKPGGVVNSKREEIVFLAKK